MSDSAPEWPIPWQAVRGDRGGPIAWIEARAVQALVAMVGVLPLAAQNGVASLLARGLRRFDRRHSDAARQFLAQAFGPAMGTSEREARVLEAWRFFLTMSMRSAQLDARIARDGLAAHFETRYAPGVRESLAARTGRIIVAPHLGDFEAGARAIPMLGIGPTYIVSRPPRNRYLSEILQRQRDARGFRLLPRHGAMDDVAKILAAQGSVVMMLDQRARKRTVLAPFFGRLAHCERAAGVLMRRLSVPVLTVWCEALEQPWRYRVHVTRVFQPEEFARASAEEIATALNREMEQMILSAPGQYFWLHDRYHQAPPPAAT